MKTQFRKALSALSLAVGFTTAATAAIPTAVWDGDFSTAEKNGYTLSLKNGGALPTTAGALALSADVLKIDKDTSYGKGAILIRYSGYAAASDKTDTALASVYPNGKTPDAGCEANGGVLKTYWGTTVNRQNWTQIGSYSKDNIMVPASGYLIVALNTDKGTAAFITDANKTTWKGGYDGGIKWTQSPKPTVDGYAVGGPRNVSPDGSMGPCATMTVEAVAVFEDYNALDQAGVEGIMSYQFPSEQAILADRVVAWNGDLANNSVKNGSFTMTIAPDGYASVADGVATVVKRNSGTAGDAYGVAVNWSASAYESTDMTVLVKYTARDFYNANTAFFSAFWGNTDKEFVYSSNGSKVRGTKYVTSGGYESQQTEASFTPPASGVYMVTMKADGSTSVAFSTYENGTYGKFTEAATYTGMRSADQPFYGFKVAGSIASFNHYYRAGMTVQAVSVLDGAWTAANFPSSMLTTVLEAYGESGPVAPIDYTATISESISFSEITWTPKKTAAFREVDSITLTVADNATLTLDEDFTIGTLKVVSGEGTLLTFKKDEGVATGIGALDLTKAEEGIVFDATEGFTACTALLEAARTTDKQFTFIGADECGATLDYGTTYENHTFAGHYIFAGGTHTFRNASESAALLFGTNATPENPTFWVKDGATLTFKSRNPCGWSAAANADGIIRIGEDSSVVLTNSTSGTWYWSQQFLFEDNSTLAIETSGDNFRVVGGSTASTPQFCLPEGAATITGLADNSLTLPNNAGSGVAFEVGEDATLTVSANLKTLADNKPFVKNGDGTLALTGDMTKFGSAFTVKAGTLRLDAGEGVFTNRFAMVNGGTVEVTGGTVFFMPGTFNGTIVENGGTAIFGYTVGINDCGRFALPAGLDPRQVALLNAGGEPVAATFDETTQTFEFDWQITGKSCWWDYEFNGSLANEGADTTTISKELTDPYYNAASNALRVGYATPWTDVSAYPQEFTAVFYGKMVDQAGHAEMGFGSSTHGTKVNVAIACGDPAADEVKILISQAFETKRTVTMTVPNACTTEHLYLVVCRTVGEGEDAKTRIVVYLDGNEWGSYTFDSVVTLGNGFQIGSVHGGIPSGGIKATKANENADLDFLRAYDVALNADAIKAYAEAYPYESPDDKAKRTVAGETTWVADGWIQTVGGVACPTNCPMPTTIVELTASADATVTMNLDEQANYASFTAQGDGALTLKAGQSVMPTVSGLVAIDTDVTLDYDAIRLDKTVVFPGNTLTFDFTDFPFDTYFASTNIVFTGLVEGEGAVTAKGLPATGVRTAVFELDENGRYALKITINAARIGTTCYQTLAAANASAKAGETITLLKDASGDGIKPTVDGLTFDFDGHTYTVTGNPVGVETSQGFCIVTASCVLTNGTLTSVSGSGVKMLVCNLSNLTLANMTLDGTNLDADLPSGDYVLSNSSGSTVVKDTTITARSGDFAFDSCHAGTSVEVTGATVLDGNVELSGGNLTFASGTLNGIIKDGGIGNAVVTKSADVVCTAPAGYYWREDTTLAKGESIAMGGGLSAGGQAGVWNVWGEGELTKTLADVLKDLGVTNLVIGAGVTEIGAGALACWHELKDVTIGNDVTNLAENAFFHCTYVTNFVIGANVAKVGATAFDRCRSLELIRFGSLAAAEAAQETYKIVARITMDGETPVVDAVPEVKIDGYTKTLKGKECLTDEEWDTVTLPLTSETPYHFFKYEYVAE